MSPAAYRALLCLGLLCGCGGAPKDDVAAKPQPRPASTAPANLLAPISNTDPCASRLHEISGALLMYGLNNRQLPQQLDELRKLPRFEHVHDLTCPVSHRPYVYNRVGFLNTETNSHVIIYDPAPSHAGMRWAISIVEPAEGGALVAKVILLPESSFVLQPVQK